MLDTLWTCCYKQQVLHTKEARCWIARTNTISLSNPNYRQWTSWAEEHIKEYHDWSKKQVVVGFIQQYIDLAYILLVQANLY